MAAANNTDLVRAMERTTVSLEHVCAAVNGLQADMRSLQNCQNTLITDISTIKSYQPQLKKDVEQLQVLVRDGNGHPSVMDRLTRVEFQVSALQGTLDSIKMSTEEVKKSVVDTETAKVASTTQLWVATISGVITIVAALIGTVAQFIGK